VDVHLLRVKVEVRVRVKVEVRVKVRVKVGVRVRVKVRVEGAHMSMGMLCLNDRVILNKHMFKLTCYV
jgi:hypothetical protein